MVYFFFLRLLITLFSSPRAVWMPGSYWFVIVVLFLPERDAKKKKKKAQLRRRHCWPLACGLYAGAPSLCGLQIKMCCLHTHSLAQSLWHSGFSHYTDGMSYALWGTKQNPNESHTLMANEHKISLYIYIYIYVITAWQCRVTLGVFDKHRSCSAPTQSSITSLCTKWFLPSRLLPITPINRTKSCHLLQETLWTFMTSGDTERLSA